jgi:hypothetical protein
MLRELNVLGMDKKIPMKLFFPSAIGSVLQGVRVQEKGRNLRVVYARRRRGMRRHSDPNEQSASLVNYPAVAQNSWRTKFTLVLVVLMTCVVAGRSAIAQEVPDATIDLWGGSVAVGIGYTWGSANLIYQGKEYPLKVSGLSILQVGASKYTASGSVYHLTQPSDINGIYTAVSAGVAVAGGASATTMKNSRGVVIQWASTHVGVNFSLAAKGVEITLQGQ